MNEGSPANTASIGSYRRSPKSYSVDMNSYNHLATKFSPYYGRNTYQKKASNDDPVYTKQNIDSFKGSFLQGNKGSTGFHAMKQAYRNLRSNAMETRSTMNSTASGSNQRWSLLYKSGGINSKVLDTQTDAESVSYKTLVDEKLGSPMQKISSVARYSGSPEAARNRRSNIQNYSASLTSLKLVDTSLTSDIDECLAKGAVHDVSSYYTKQKPKLQNTSGFKGLPLVFRKLAVCKPDFRQLFRKYVEDDFPPYPSDDENVQYEYLDVGSFRDLGEPKEVIQEVDEEDESPLPKADVLNFRTQAALLTEEDEEHENYSVIIKEVQNDADYQAGAEDEDDENDEERKSFNSKAASGRREVGDAWHFR